jgi:hypothetical protein
MSTHRIYQLRYIAARTSLALACALLWQPSAAQTPIATSTSSTTAFAHDPAAKVPTVEYRSVFKETSLGVEKDSTDWRKANDEVGKFSRGHVDILKWEEQEAAKPNATKPIAAPAHQH